MTGRTHGITFRISPPRKAKPSSTQSDCVGGCDGKAARGPAAVSPGKTRPGPSLARNGKSCGGMHALEHANTLTVPWISSLAGSYPALIWIGAYQVTVPSWVSITILSYNGSLLAAGATEGLKFSRRPDPWLWRDRDFRGQRPAPRLGDRVDVPSRLDRGRDDRDCPGVAPAGAVNCACTLTTFLVPTPAAPSSELPEEAGSRKLRLGPRRPRHAERHRRQKNDPESTPQSCHQQHTPIGYQRLHIVADLICRGNMTTIDTRSLSL